MSLLCACPGVLYLELSCLLVAAAPYDPVVSVIYGEDVESKTLKAVLTRDWLKTSQPIDAEQYKLCCRYRHRHDMLRLQFQFVSYSDVYDEAPSDFFYTGPVFRLGDYGQWTPIPPEACRGTEAVFLFWERLRDELHYDRRVREWLMFTGGKLPGYESHVMGYLKQRQQADAERYRNWAEARIAAVFPAGIDADYESGKGWIYTDVRTGRRYDRDPRQAIREGAQRPEWYRDVPPPQRLWEDSRSDVPVPSTKPPDRHTHEG